VREILFMIVIGDKRPGNVNQVIRMQVHLCVKGEMALRADFKELM
jgi:hypothetical protein